MSKTSGTYIHALVIALTSVVAAPTLWSQSINVSLSPSTATVSVGQTFQFSAKVTPASKSGITWNVNGITGGNAITGTISSSGLYTAPAVLPSPSSFFVSAVSITDPSKSANALVTVVSAGPPTVSVAVTPSSASLQVSQTLQFAATVSNSSNANVTWSVNGVLGGDATNGTISTSGLFTAPAAVPPSPVTVTATSVADASKSGQASVTVTGPALTISPSATSVPTSQSVQFSVIQASGSKKPVIYTWSVNGIQGGNSVVGTISNKGLYTAPALPPSPATTTIMAMNADNQSAQASATVVSVISVTVSPASASVVVSQTQQFTASVSGTSNTSVTWGVNGNSGGNSTVGTISPSGLYTAPVGVPVPASVTVTATSVADTTKSANATLTVSPTVTVSVSPTSVTLSNSQTQLFAATVTGSSNSLVVWSLSASLGTISAFGQYQAPSSIPGPQTVTITATTVVDPITSGSATISLVPDTTPPSVTMTSPSDPAAVVGGNITLAATASDNVAVVGVRFLVDGLVVGPEVTTPPYSAAWSTSTYQNGVHAISVVARDAAGNSATASANVTVSNATTQVILPVEVVGAAGTTQTVTVNLASPPVSGARLWMQIHNLKYQTEASVQINGGLWLPINDTTVTLEGLASAYGGIGGGFSTIKMSLSLPTGSLVAGPNTVTFRFNGTDGVSSGFRVLNFNFLDSDGSQLIGADTFVQDDPNSWQPPSTVADDIAAGKLLWHAANLTAPGVGAIQAKCGSCHAQDGRDLKYFNYSNNSIRARSIFHGLSTEQADQIVSYIRSLNVPNPGRPWNPPYQPGPGLDSQPVENWAAGAGLDAVLNADADMMPYIMPGGNTATWAWNSYLNARETPISFQLPDWNRWLPTLYPTDAWGSTFDGSSLYTEYLNIRSQLQPNDPTAYANVTPDLMSWMNRDGSFLLPLIQPSNSTAWSDLTYVQKIHSVRLWDIVKLWEINQEFGLEGMARVAFGPQAPDRAWYSNMPFFISPFMSAIPRPSVGVGNGKVVTHAYLSFAWYQLQLLLNDGNGTNAGQYPVDFNYAIGYPTNDLSWDSATSTPRVSTGGLLALWLVKALQNATDNSTNPALLVGFPAQVSTWSQMSTPQKLQIMNGYLSAWFAKYGSYTAQQLFAATVLASPTFDPTQQQSFGGSMVYALPQLRYQGVDPDLLKQVVAWLYTIWPAYNWSNILNAPCSVLNLSQIVCTPTSY